VSDHERPFGFGENAYFDSAIADWIDPNAEAIPFAEGVELPPHCPSDTTHWTMSPPTSTGTPGRHST
jgi:hypothetical protein